MRDRFHHELDQLRDRVVDLITLVEDSVELATRGLLTADRSAAESVISKDLLIDDLCRHVERTATELQIRQQPVARDLRLIFVIQRVVTDIAHCGDLTRSIAKLTRRHYPGRVVPPPMEETIAEMADSARKLLRRAGCTLCNQDASVTRELEPDDGRVAELHRALLCETIANTNCGAVDAAIDVALCGRYYERIADHAVAIASQIVYLSTGEHV